MLSSSKSNCSNHWQLIMHIISVYRNGDPLTLPAKILLVKSTLQNWESVLDEITRKVSLSSSAVLKYMGYFWWIRRNLCAFVDYLQWMENRWHQLNNLNTMECMLLLAKNVTSVLNILIRNPSVLIHHRKCHENREYHSRVILSYASLETVCAFHMQPYTRYLHLTVYFFSHLAIGPIINFPGMYEWTRTNMNTVHQVMVTVVVVCVLHW